MTTQKYRLGERLTPIQSLNGRSLLQRPFDCTVISLEGNLILYGFSKDYGFPEYDVFASEAEAQAECDRRNARPG